MDHDRYMHKELVTVIVEKALLEIGLPVYSAVLASLKSKYGCDISDCYEKPECLRDALEEYFGSASNAVVDNINEDLRTAAKNDQIERFLLVLNNKA